MTTLSELLPSRSRLTAIRDEPGCLAHFILIDQLKNAQMGQYPTTILATEHSKEHWMACAKKLVGISLIYRRLVYKSKGSPFHPSTSYIDGLNKLAEGEENTLKELLEETTNSLRSYKQPDTPSKLLIDDLACLSWLGFTDSDIEWFIKNLLKMAEEVSVLLSSILEILRLARLTSISSL